MHTFPWISAPIAVVCLVAAPAVAWNDFGHMLSARLAYAQLSPEARARLTAILKKHPQYEALADKCPLNTDKDLWVFMRAATWPDMLRTTTNPLHATDHHATWHYVNYPIDRDGVKGPTPDPVWKAGTDPANILQALQKCAAELKDEKLPDADKAKALCWYLHLVGDLHQPLHATALFSKDFPKGDRGGNSFIVDNGGRISRLHSIWDGILANDEIGANVDARAKQLEQAPEVSKDKLKPELAKTTYVQWAQESYELAKTAVYANGELKNAKPAGNDTLPTTAPALPAKYIEEGRKVGEKRIVLAGIRIAEGLNKK